MKIVMAGVHSYDANTNFWKIIDLMQALLFFFFFLSKISTNLCIFFYFLSPLIEKLCQSHEILPSYFFCE